MKRSCAGILLVNPRKPLEQSQPVFDERFERHLPSLGGFGLGRWQRAWAEPDTGRPDSLCFSHSFASPLKPAQIRLKAAACSLSLGL
jgi:hypothetical protein